MNDITSLQESFQQFILSGQSSIDQSIVQTTTVSVDTRLAIYHDAYRLRLIESLGVNFPALFAYLGTEAFEKTCIDYIKIYPSNYRSIRWYGSDLEEFLTGYYDKSSSFLAELAALEWKMTLAFDAADAPVLQVAELAQIAPELWPDLRFTIHPSLQKMNYFWNITALWQALIDDKDLPELHHHSTATSWILWRSQDYQLHFYSLSEEEAWALDNLAKGLPFSELCEGLCQWLAVEEVGMKAASYLKAWIQKGMLSELSG